MKRVAVLLPWPLSAKETRDVLIFAFQTFLVTYLVLTLIENIQPGFVSGFIDLNWWMWATVISGVSSAGWQYIMKEVKVKNMSLTWSDGLWIFFLGLGVIAALWNKIATIGSYGQTVTMLIGAVIIGLSLLVWNDRDETSE